MNHIFDYIFHIIVPVAHAAENGNDQSVTALLGLNWKLFIAQLVNFGIVLFVLWKWVFGPVGTKLQERTDRIEKSLQQAKEIEEKHEAAEQQRILEIERARKEANEIVDKAQKAAIQTKEQILAEAKQASDKMIEQTKQQLADEKNKLMREVREEVAGLVVMATEKLLRSKLDPHKDEQLIKESLKNI